jgi:hypothetical protein
VPDQFPTIQAAVDAAIPGDEVLVAPGLYEEHVIIDVSDLTLLSEIVHGAIIREEWVIFSLASGITIKGFIIESSTVFTHGASPLVLYGDGFLVESCRLSRGRPCASLGGDGTMRDCSISEAAGGVEVRDGATILFERCDFVSNVDMSIGGDGALQVITIPSDPTGCNVTVTDCHFVGNMCPIGGAVYIEGADHFPQVTIERSLFKDNSARSGPAVHCLNSNLTMRSCTITGNTVMESSINGGVIAFEDARQRSAIIDRCIVAGNAGPAMKCFLGAMPAVSCSDLFANTTNDLCGVDAGGNFSLDPLFCNSSADDFTLMDESPCSPEHSPGDCGLIGAFPVVCVSAVTPTTWGVIKHQFGQVPGGRGQILR